jgi:dTDP-4-dehydrorhamnose 3,5-epimerase
LVQSIAGQSARLSAADLRPDIASRLSTQQYDGKPRLHDVLLLDLRASLDAGGAFMETARLDENGRMKALPDHDFRVRQTNYSEIEPGAVKAWHLHFNQEDVWFVPPRDRVLVGLWDVRADSPTSGLTMRFVLGAGRPQLLYIPRGVAHGVANLGAAPAQVWYFVNQEFDPQAPDEHRLPWDAAGAEFWEIEKG